MIMYNYIYCVVLYWVLCKLCNQYGAVTVLRNTGIMKCRTQGICTVQLQLLFSPLLLPLVHSVLSVRDTIYCDCRQCTVCQGHDLLGLYTVYCLSGTRFTATVDSVLSVRDTIHWDSAQCTLALIYASNKQWYARAVADVQLFYKKVLFVTTTIPRG
jgi:hypothetical protein